MEEEGGSEKGEEGGGRRKGRRGSKVGAAPMSIYHSNR